MAIGDRQEHTTTIDMVRRTLTSCQLVRKGLTRQKGIDTFDATQKLREVGGYTVIIGTPWSPEDLYATLIRRRQADDESPESEKMRIRIDPAWTVRPDARHKQLRQLVEADVDLLFPSRLTLDAKCELRTKSWFVLVKTSIQSSLHQASLVAL